VEEKHAGGEKRGADTLSQQQKFAVRARVVINIKLEIIFSFALVYLF